MKKKSGRIALTLPRELLKSLGLEVAKVRKLMPGRKVSRAEVVREILANHLAHSSTQPEDRSPEALSRQASELKEQAREAASHGSRRRSSKLLLQAAARELEALSMADEGPDDKPQLRHEHAIKSTLIEVLVLLKEATGYKHLPDLPSRPKLELVQVQTRMQDVEQSD